MTRSDSTTAYAAPPEPPTPLSADVLGHANDRLFHKTGLGYFWLLNDDCTPAVMDQMIDAYARANVSNVVLHPRCGLRVPYGGADWFALIRRTVQRCAERGLQVWLYDEEPFPSGAAGGRVFIEHPEYEARGIECFEHDPAKTDAQPADTDANKSNGNGNGNGHAARPYRYEEKIDDTNLFCFPTGNLLWCGLVDPDTGATRDLTERVGLLRRTWCILDPWDSRYYYPQTPLYEHPRAMTTQPEYALRTDELPAEAQVNGGPMKLVAFVARPAGRDTVYGGLPDSLNPDATQQYLRLTHENYKQAVGEYFGNTITAVFTDEPKMPCAKPWTPGMFESFERAFGYDLRPRLYDLFSDRLDERACLTRLHYRQWCAQRFERAWLAPVAEWCHRHNLKLTGHISPEDDPVEQANCVGNLFPLFKHFDLAGIDLIIPAVGDRDHPLINVGIVCASSAAAQQNQIGIMSESLACSGIDAPTDQSRKILHWQTVMGLTSPIVHYAQNSTEGPRAIDAPPDSGPFSTRWAGMQTTHRTIQPLQQVVRAGTQVAPVALLWPIRSFWLQQLNGLEDPTGLRTEFINTLSTCLDQQVGTHIIDEDTLQDAAIEQSTPDGACMLTIGRAAYSHIIVPACHVLSTGAIDRLKHFADQGGRVMRAGEAPRWQQDSEALTAADLSWCESVEPTALGAHLPRLIDFEEDATDVRCTGWRIGSRIVRLLMNLRSTPVTLTAEGASIELAAGEARVLDQAPDQTS